MSLPRLTTGGAQPSSGGGNVNIENTHQILGDAQVLSCYSQGSSGVSQSCVSVSNAADDLPQHSAAGSAGGSRLYRPPGSSHGGNRGWRRCRSFSGDVKGHLSNNVVAEMGSSSYASSDAGLNALDALAIPSESSSTDVVHQLSDGRQRRRLVAFTDDSRLFEDWHTHSRRRRPRHRHWRVGTGTGTGTQEREAPRAIIEFSTNPRPAWADVGLSDESDEEQSEDDPCQDLDTPAEDVDLLADPTNVRNPGSSKHASGDCKPCMYLATKIGCKNGRRCRFCHYPHEKKSRPRPGKAARLQCKRIASRLELDHLALDDEHGLGEGTVGLDARTAYMCTVLRGKQRLKDANAEELGASDAAASTEARLENLGLVTIPRVLHRLMPNLVGSLQRSAGSAVGNASDDGAAARDSSSHVDDGEGGETVEENVLYEDDGNVEEELHPSLAAASEKEKAWIDNDGEASRKESRGGLLTL